MSHCARDPSGRGRLDYGRLAPLFHNCLIAKSIIYVNVIRWELIPSVLILFFFVSIWLIYFYYRFFLPYDILGLFILSFLDQKKKFFYILDPLPRPTWGLHIIKNMEICNKINLALQRINPKWKDDTSKWGRKVCIVPTNSNRYETFHLNITLLDLFNA